MAEQQISSPGERIYNPETFEYHLTEVLKLGKSQVCLFLSGKTGVGKSHLTNALIGKDVAEEGDSLDPTTMESTPYQTEMNGVTITAWDTPGMADGSQGDQAYLKSMPDKIKEFDLFLYCAEMNTRRVRNDDIKCIQNLTEAFGHHLWNNALIILTFANEVHPPKGESISSEAYFTERLRKFKMKYYQELEKAGIPELIVHSIPVVPVGDLHEPELPDRGNWITAMWIHAFKRMTREAKPAMLLFNYNRMKFPPGVVEGAEKLIDGSGDDREESTVRQVELSQERRKRFSNARLSFLNLEEESSTSENQSPRNDEERRWSYEQSRESGSPDLTQKEAGVTDQLDHGSDSSESETPAFEEDTSQPSTRTIGNNDESKANSSSSKENDKHKKKIGADELAIVPLKMSRGSVEDVISEVSKGDKKGSQGNSWSEFVRGNFGSAVSVFIKVVEQIVQVV